MRSLKLFALLVVVFSSAFATEDYRKGKTPSWVVPINSPELPDNSSDLTGQTIHYRLVDNQVNITPEFRVQRYSHIVEKPLTIDGLQTSGAIEIFFKPDYQQVTLHEFKVIRQGDVINPLETARISVLDVEPESENNLYSGYRKILILVANYRLGDSLEYAYTITGQNPVFGQSVLTHFGLGWSVPVDRVYRRLTVPKDIELSHRIAHLDAELKQSETKGFRSYALQLENTPAYTEDPQAPSFSNIYPYVAFSNYQSWQQVTQWAKPLFQYQVPENGSTWHQWLEEIKAQKNTEAKVTHALQLVQDNIRYVGIEIGENSHRPHTPSETMTLGYGDCKDKTLLLVSLLTAAGIEAEPFLVDTQYTEALTDFLPRPSVFNHVITRVRINDQYQYVDPTLSYQAGDRVSQRGYYNYAYGLPVYSQSEGLITMPARNVDQPTMNIKQVIQSYDYTMPVLLTSTSIYSHSEADYQRYRFANTSLDNIQNNYLDYYSQLYGDTQIAEPIVYHDNKARNEFKITVTLWVNDFFHYNADTQSFEYDIEAYAIDDYLAVPKRINRRQPYWLSSLTNIAQEIHVRHPTIYNPTKSEPVSVKFNNDAFSFNVESFELADETFYNYQYQNKTRYIEPEQLPTYAESIRKAREHISYNGWFTGSAAPEKDTAARQFFKSFLKADTPAEGTK